jgi:small-conductance mechanosensitive channel
MLVVFKIDLTNVIFGLGVGGIAIALAIQSTLSDVFSAFSIYFDRPFEIGDFIVVGEHSGTVKSIGIKSTRIQALSGEEITLSNQELTSARIRNFKRMHERRVVFGFGILYETSPETVERIPTMVRTIIESIDNTRFDRAHFKSFGDSSLDFEVVYYVLDSDYGVYMDIQQRINVALMKTFADERIGFAYPTRTVYMASSETTG